MPKLKRGFSAADGLSAEIDLLCCEYRILDGKNSVCASICLGEKIQLAYGGSVILITDNHGELMVDAADPPGGIGYEEIFEAHCTCRSGGDRSAPTEPGVPDLETKTEVGVISDDTNPYCGQMLYVDADGDRCVFDNEQGQWVVLEGDLIPMSITAVNYNPSTGKKPVVGQLCVEIPAGTDDTAQALIDAAIAAEAPVGTVDGSDYAFTIDDVSSFNIRMTGDCPVNVKGVDRVVYDDTAEGGVTLDVPVVTTDTPAELSVCFKKELTKEEIAAL